MALLNIQPYSSHTFSANVESKMLVVEHSTLCRGEFLHRLYDDACDVGMAIRSERTGAVTYWHDSATVKDEEGDLQVTILQATSETLRKFPHLEGWTVHVLND